MIISLNRFAITTMLLLLMLSASRGFHVPQQHTIQQQPSLLLSRKQMRSISTTTSLGIFGNNKKNDDDELIPGKKMTKGRRKILGVNDDEEEYDLEMALDNSTDPLITKIIAGSLILSILALLVFGLVIPLTTDYGDGVCNALLNGGRC